MAEIRDPMTGAMKRRAKAAIDAAWEPPSRSDGTIDEDARPDYGAYTPRELRAIILRQARDLRTRTALTAEGWFEPSLSEGFKAASNTKLSL